MAKTIKYTGTQRGWPELAYTGKQSIWFPGQTEERSDSEAGQLLGSGQFTEVFALDDLPLPSLVSGDGNVTVNSRDGLGRATSYTDTTGTYAVTYGSFGPATVSGNGKITTYNYSAAGLLTSTTTV